jgi:hypothetical protein
MKNPYLVSAIICITAIPLSFINPMIGFVVGSIGVMFTLLVAIWNSIK